jgi:soluble lytic murein transglycosylase-like protein
MNTWTRSRVSRVAIATALFLVVSLNSPPSLPSVPTDQPEPPSPAEIRVLEEVAEWVLGQPLTERFRAFREPDVVAAVRSRSQSFDLFRSFGEASIRSELLERLPYGRLIDRAARRYRVDGLLLASIMEAESGFNPHAISPQGALGLMQVMPDNAGSHTVEELLEPAVNIEIGTRYLVRLLDQFDGDLTLALAGYNAGPGSVKRYGGVPPFSETRGYVDRVLTRYVRLHRNLWRTSGDSEWLF